MIFTLRFLPLVLFLACSSCSARRMSDDLAMHRAGRSWAIVQQKDSQDYIIFAEDETHLNEALATTGCKHGPCAISRLGDVYQVHSMTGK